MNKHQIRIIIGAVIAILVDAACLYLLSAAALAMAGFCFTLLAILIFAGSLYRIAGNSKNSWLTNAAFPLVTGGYAVFSILFSVVMILLERFGDWVMPTAWFILAQSVLTALCCWKILAMKSGQEIIEDTGRTVQKKTDVWKSILENAEAILNRTGSASFKEVSAVRDAVRYADPVSAPELEVLENTIAENIIRLGQLTDGKKTGEISELCAEILRLIKNRNIRTKQLKQ